MPITLQQFQARRQRAGLWPSKEVFFDDLAVFVFGAAAVYDLNVVGSLPGSELLTLVLLPYLLLVHGGFRVPREYRWFYILLALWLFGTIANDLYLGVTLTNRIKGIARIVFLGLDFTVLAVIAEAARSRLRFMIVFVLSTACVYLWYFYSARGTQAFDVQWKYGGSSTLTIIGLLISSYYFEKKRYLVCFAISVALVIINLRYAFRSQMAIDLMAGLLILPPLVGKASKGGAGSARQTVRILLVLVLVGGAAALANKVILYAAQNGYFDAATQQKFEDQSSGKLGVLVGGRPETLVAIQAIRDSPIVGHGSYAVDPKYWVMEADLQFKYGYTSTDYVEDLGNTGIPTHSHLTLAWVESGILGGVFWSYILFLTLYSIVVLVRLQPPLTPLYCYLLLNFVWDILYSPMGAANRIWNAYVILIACELMRAQAAARLAAPSRMRLQAPFVRKRVRLV